MTLRTEYKPSFLPLPNAVVGYQTYLFEDILPLPDDIAWYVRRGEKIPKDVFARFGEHIDHIIQDGGIEIYLGSIRRQFKMFNMVPSNEEVVEELCLLSGATNNDALLPMVEYWKFKRDAVVESVLPVADAWANWYVHSMHTYLTYEELQEAAREIAFKLVTFNWIGPEGELTGNMLLRYIYASMKPMLFHFEARKSPVSFDIDASDLSTDLFERDDLDVDRWYTPTEYGVPEPDRFVSVRHEFEQPFREDIPVENTPPNPIAALPKVPLENVFAALGSLPPIDRYVLLHYLGYFGFFQKVKDFCDPIGIDTHRVFTAWHRLNSAIQNAEYGQLMLPEMMDQARDIVSLRAEAQSQHDGHYALISELLQQIDSCGGVDAAYQCLDENAQQMLSILLKNLSLSSTGRVKGFHGRSLQADVAQLTGKDLASAYTYIKKFIRLQILPQLRGDR